MKSLKIIFAAQLILLCSLVCFSQTNGRKNVAPQTSTASSQAAKSSPAYAELLVAKTELSAQLEDFADYTEDFPKIKEMRFQLDLLQKASDKMLALGVGDAAKLSLGLGKLVVRKTEFETSLWMLQKKYKDDYPEVKRLKRKVEVFDRAIREILPTL